VRRPLFVLVALLIATTGVPGAGLIGAGLTRAGADVPILVINGRGFGHGVGLAQDGAFWMASSGQSTNQILGHFYPGTALSRRTGVVRVAVYAAPDRSAALTFPNGGDVRDAPSGQQSPGFPVRVGPGGQVRIWFDGAYHAQVTSDPAPAASRHQAQAFPPVLESTTTTGPTTTTTLPTFPTPGAPPTTGPSSTTTSSPPAPSGSPPPPPPPPSSSRPLLAVPADGGTVAVDARGRQYRGFLQADASQGPLRLVNQLDVQQYLQGMGEVRDPRWPAAGLRAQAIVARTYALRAMAAVGELCDDQRCQVYLGAQAEYPAMNRAVADTQGQVVVFRGQLASTVYSANGGGTSATPEEGFGTDSAAYPYLRAAPYLTRDPAPWTVKVALTDLAARFGYAGQLSGARITRRGPSGRAEEVTLDGSAAPKAIDGLAFDAGLGLRSTLFDVQLAQGPAPPPPPPGLVQALPDQAPTSPLAGATVHDLGSAFLDNPRAGAAPAARADRAATTSGGFNRLVAGLATFLLLAAVAATSVWVTNRKGGP